MCFSYGKLNGITKTFEIPIPRCDYDLSTVGDGTNKIWSISLDARQKYHQLSVRHVDREKLSSSHQTTRNIPSLSYHLGPLTTPVYIQLR